MAALLLVILWMVVAPLGQTPVLATLAGIAILAGLLVGWVAMSRRSSVSSLLVNVVVFVELVIESVLFVGGMVYRILESTAVVPGDHPVESAIFGLIFVVDVFLAGIALRNVIRGAKRRSAPAPPLVDLPRAHLLS
jgi:hypothetical protein